MLSTAHRAVALRHPLQVDHFQPTLIRCRHISGGTGPPAPTCISTIQSGGMRPAVVDRRANRKYRTSQTGGSRTFPIFVRKWRLEIDRNGSLYWHLAQPVKTPERSFSTSLRRRTLSSDGVRIETRNHGTGLERIAKWLTGWPWGDGLGRCPARIPSTSVSGRCVPWRQACR